MAAYRRVYDSRHLQADCQEPGSAREPYRVRVTFAYNVRGCLTARHCSGIFQYCSGSVVIVYVHKACRTCLAVTGA